MKRTMAMTAAVLVAMLASGCATPAFVTAHNERVIRDHAVRVEGTQGGVLVGVDVLHMRGLWAALKADPAGGAWALTKDIGGGALATYGVVKLLDNGDGNDAPPVPPQPTYQTGDIRAEGGAVVIVGPGVSNGNQTRTENRGP